MGFAPPPLKAMKDLPRALVQWFIDLTTQSMRVVESDFLFSDITTANSSASKHGLLPKLSGLNTTFLRGDGSWATPAGGGDVVGPGAATDNAITRYNGATGTSIQNSLATIDDSGTVNIPTGETYNINGSPHYHTSMDLGGKVTSSVSKTNTTLADITGLSITLANGLTYAFKAVLYYDADGTGGHKYAMSGTVGVANIILQIDSVSNATNAFVINSRQTALNASAGQAGSTAGMTIIEGTITTNGAGTLTVQFAQNAASGTSTILTGSTLRAWSIT